MGNLPPDRSIGLILIDCPADLDHLHLPGGYQVCWAVDPDGERWPVIADDRRLDEHPPVLWGERLVAEVAPHEGLGPLPAATRAALAWQCGAPTIYGRGCRIVVDGPGQRCPIHRDMGP